jgi:type II secretory pathway component PulJ
VDSPSIRIPRSRLRPGLTLLEVVLAVALTVLLMGMVFGLHRQLLGRRDQVRRRSEAVFAQRRVLDLMADELRSAMVYEMFRLGMTGQEESIRFMQVTVPTHAVYLTPNIVHQGSVAGDEGDDAFAPQHDVGLVGYRLRRYEDEEGVERVAGLERTCQRTIQAATSEEGDNVEVHLLTDHVKYLRLMYLGPEGDWRPGWRGESLPAAVRIEIGRRAWDAEEEMEEEYPYPTQWRVVAIPGGLAIGGGASAGGGGRVRTGGGDVFRGGDVFEGGDVYGGNRDRRRGGRRRP